MTLLAGVMKTSTASSTVFIGVRRPSFSSFSRNKGGAKAVAEIPPLVSTNTKEQLEW